MNANLFDLVRDAWYIMRLRYRPSPLQYRYGLPVFVVVLFAIGLANAVGFAPMMGTSLGAIVFGVLSGVTRFFVLTRCCTYFLPDRAMGKRLPYLGYVLAGEALIIPSLFAYAFPEMMPLLTLWNMWAFWAQAMGFTIQSGQKLHRVLFAYIVSSLISVVLLSLFLLLFFQAGWLDANEIIKNVREILQQNN